MENSKSQSPDLNYILRVHSGANLIIKHHIKTKPTFSFQFDILRNHKIYPKCIGRNEIKYFKGCGLLEHYGAEHTSSRN